MKEQIERHFQELVGLRLTKTTRAANMECLKFGHMLETNKAGQRIEISELALHLQSPWRFTSDTNILSVHLTYMSLLTKMRSTTRILIGTSLMEIQGTLNFKS